MNNNNNADNDDSVEEIESSQRSQLYNIPANDSLNETIPFENKAAESEANVEDKERDEAFEQLFSLVISPEEHCVICNTNISELDSTVKRLIKSPTRSLFDIFYFILATRVARQQVYRCSRETFSEHRKVLVYHLQQGPNKIQRSQTYAARK